MRWRRIWLGAALGALLATAGLRAAETDAALTARARTILHHYFDTDRTMVRVHAAEAMASTGEGRLVREQLTRERAGNEASIYRVGIWRLLASTAINPYDRTQWIERVEGAFLNPRAADRAQAVEALGKLNHRAKGKTLEALRARAASEPEAETISALWVLELAHEPGALTKLTKALGSKDPVTRQRAAYAVRWLEPIDLALKQALSRAIAAEPVDSAAYPFILSAAVTLRADRDRLAEWQGKLEGLLATGTPAARYEACQTLMRRFGAADVAKVATLLDEKDPEVQVAAAWTILWLLDRRG
jgi:hypothetical protein